MPIAAGKLRKRVRIEEYVSVLDSNGDTVQDETTGEMQKAWQTVAEVWASIEPLSASEFIQSASMQSAVTAKIEIRYRTGLHAAMRFVHVVNGADVAIYNPEGLLPDAQTGLEYLTIPVSTGVNQGQ